MKNKKQTPFKRALSRDSERGQVSIFLGIILLVVVSFIAFVINVGLFVKAKINLQNAVDAAAYAGASVQARQLTNIGHLNWELRNTYKEWMYKYYILGQIGLDAIDNIDGNEPNGGPKLNNGGMNFRLRQFKGSSNQYYNKNIFDRYNVPSTCIHYGSNNNICEIVSIPGLPRFNTVGLPSISEHHEAFLNSIVATKAEDCSSRSNINQGAAMLWAYGTESADLFPDIPEIAAERPGAWVQALEIGMRMRNLESIVNSPPMTDFVCIQPGGRCTQPITALTDTGNSMPFNERVVKSFMSAYRNLSGGAGKDSRDRNDFGTKFRMRELPPTALQVDPLSLSGFLIPGDANRALTKSYLDLQVYPINFATFYTTFVSNTGSFKNSGTKSEADCGGTKTALPVPGYILGFFKNPEVLTYYAVEGESDFVGLFYPFTDRDGITLKTYAAAKPFGGRVGPALFKIQDSIILPREDARLTLTANYVSAFDVSSLAGSAVEAGYPIPIDTSFWAGNGSSIGGNPESSSGDLRFGIPNLIYDYDNYADIANLGIARGNINTLRPALADSNAYSASIVEKDYGLYDIKQFRKFAANKTTANGAALTNQEVLQGIYNVRRPTRYEALNYLVPVMDYDGSNSLKIDQNSYVYPLEPLVAGATNPQTKLYRLYAPLIGPNSLYQTASSVTEIVNNYINSNSGAVKKYNDALKVIADQMRDEARNSVGGDAYLSAANSIHQEPSIIKNTDVASPECVNLSMAQKFNMFFSTTGSGCGITPISEHVTKYFTVKENSNPNQWKSFYVSVYTEPDFSMLDLMTGYKPGLRQGVGNDDLAGSPFILENRRIAKRNSYSTKFFPMRAVMSDQTYFDGTGLPIYAEGDSGDYKAAQMFSGVPMHNVIDPSELAAYKVLWF